MHTGETITQFIIEEQRNSPNASGDFTALLSDVVTACKAISSCVNQGALVGVLGSAGSENIQGETQKKLDILKKKTEVITNLALNRIPDASRHQRVLFRRYLRRSPNA